MAMGTVRQAPASPAAHRWVWRPVMTISGALFLIGGVTHPSSEDTVAVRESLLSELADPSWLSSHLFLTTAAVLQLAGIWLMRRDETIRSRLATSWPAVVAACAFYALAEIPHTFASHDLEHLETGRATPLVDLYLTTGVIAYPAMGVALAWLAFNLARGHRVGALAIGALGVVGSFVYGIAAPLSMVDGAFNILFPLGAIPHAWWLILLGVVGMRPARRRRETKTSTLTTPAG